MAAHSITAEMIQQHLDAVARLVAAGGTPEQVATLLYADNALVVGRDMPHAVRGHTACTELLREVLEYWGKRPKLRYKMHEPIVSSADRATVMVEIGVQGDRAEVASLDYRAIYALERRNLGWRVVLEMYDNGIIDPSAANA